VGQEMMGNQWPMHRLPGSGEGVKGGRGVGALYYQVGDQILGSESHAWFGGQTQQHSYSQHTVQRPRCEWGSMGGRSSLQDGAAASSQFYTQNSRKSRGEMRRDDSFACEDQHASKRACHRLSPSPEFIIHRAILRSPFHKRRDIKSNCLNEDSPSLGGSSSGDASMEEDLSENQGRNHPFDPSDWDRDFHHC